MNLLEAFQQVLLKYELVERKDKILIAVSGGVDSTVLLDLFNAVKEKFDLQLQVIHINHGLRGSESDSDADFVMEFARRYHLPCLQKRVDTRTYAISNKLSIEDSARILRYRFFDDMLRATQFNKVAMAHNADDQAETILDHLMRGSGIRGLAGIAIERDHYIRPLLNFSRHDIEHYASDNKIKYRIDSSNWELKYKRNRIRHELIPYIKREFNPKISQVLIRSGEIFRETENYLMSQAAEALKTCLLSSKSNEIVLHLPRFLSAISIIQQYIIFNILEKLGMHKSLIRYQIMDRILKLAQEGKSGNRVQMSDDWEVVISRDQLVFHERFSENFMLEVKVNETYYLFRGEVTFRTEIVEPSEKIPEFSSDPTIEYIDFDKIQLPLYLRNPQKGDKFRPLNMRGEKKLSDFFIDEKVPNYLRGRVPVLECQDGIIWVCGYRIDDRYKISKNTKQILRIEICEGCYDRVPPERF